MNDLNFEFEGEFCAPYGYKDGIDPYKGDKPLLKFYVPTTEQLNTIIINMGFHDYSRTEELSLGEDCVLLVDIKCGFIDLRTIKTTPFRGIKFWVEVYIRNGHILPEDFPEKIRAGTGIEYTISGLDIRTYEKNMQSTVMEVLEVFKKKIWPYREQLIEFIKQNS